MKPTFRISRAAERDLLEIARFTTERWGATQCRRYLEQLDACFRRIAEAPDRGRSCDEIRAGYWRLHEGKHVVFYRLGRGDLVEIIRVLHERMLPDSYL